METWGLNEKGQAPGHRSEPGTVPESSLHPVLPMGSGGMWTTLGSLLWSSQSPLGNMAVSASSSSESWEFPGIQEKE
jgi:hypothetical protein